MRESLRQRTLRLLHEHSLRPSKRRGQHFLVDEGVARDIAAAAEPGGDDIVLEIGAGLGALTEHLAGAARRVVAVEVDRGVAGALRELAAEWPVEVLHEDFLELDIDAVCAGPGPWKVVGNLPYNVTSPILHRLREHVGRFERCIVTMQTEVADRLRARPGSRAYGAMTVAMQAELELEDVRSVPAQAFHPAPDVMSEVVCLRRVAKPLVVGGDRELLEQVVRAAFAQRRKTILNSLVGSRRLEASREELAGALEAAGIDAGRRAETVSVEEFVALAKAVASR